MKTKSRLGKTDSIFAKTDKVERKSDGTQPAGSSLDNRVTFVIPPDQIAFLDRLCLDIRGKTGGKVRRTEIIRALVAGLKNSGMDLTAYATEDAIADVIHRRLKG